MSDARRTPATGRLLGVLLVLSLVVFSCGTQTGEEPEVGTTERPEQPAQEPADEPAPEPEPASLLIVVTTTILGDVVANIVGDDAEVEVLMPAGADPHDFHPSSQQVARINQADLVVANGLLLEEGLVSVLAAARDDGANILEVAPLVHPVEFDPDDHEHHHDDADDQHHHDEDEHHHDENGHEHHHDGPDPHVWMEPLRMVEAVGAIAAELTALDDSIEWMARAEAYADQLIEAHQAIEAILGRVPEQNRKLVTNHDSFGYLALRYGFEVVGAVIPGGATLAEPGSRELAQLVAVIEREGVRAIFSEAGMPDALPRALAEEVGFEVAVVELYSDSLGEPGSGADTLIGMLITNAGRIADALG